MLKVSIVIPTYNSANTLEKAIKSVLNQTYHNIELIIVDDGSTDSTKKIVHSFSDSNNIVYVYQENRGVSVARNRGIAKSTGEYLFFLDSDDYIDSDLIAKMVEIGAKDDLDLVSCSYYESNSLRYGGNSDKNNSFIAKTTDEFSHYFLDLFPQSASAKLFKRKIILDYQVSFPVGMNLGEDLFFVYSYLIHTESCGKISGSFYRIQNINSESLSKRYVENIENDIKLQYSLWEKLINCHPNIEMAYYEKRIDFRFYLLSIYASNYFKQGCILSLKEKISIIRNFIKKNPEWFEHIKDRKKYPKNLLELLSYVVLISKNTIVICSFFGAKEFIKKRRMMING